MTELDVSKATAERTLREHKGDIIKALHALTNWGHLCVESTIIRNVAYLFTCNAHAQCCNTLRKHEVVQGLPLSY